MVLPVPEDEKSTTPRADWAFFKRLDEVTDDIEDPGRWPMMRDLLVFQGKLALDALRDLALSPISLTAGVLGIIRDPDRPGRYFYSLMKLGTRSDRWINLFGASRMVGYEPGQDKEPSIDGLVNHLENLVVRQFEQGGVTAQAKDAIDTALHKLHEAALKEGEKFKGNSDKTEQ